MPQAKAFKRWVTSEVLPAIRWNGSYALPQDPREMAISMATAIVEMAPKAENWDGFCEGEGSGMLVREVANLMRRRYPDITMPLLFELLKAWTVCYASTTGGYVAYASASKRGWITQHWLPTPRGNRPYIRITPRGVEYIAHKLAVREIL